MVKIFIAVKKELAYTKTVDKLIAKWEKKGKVLVFARQYSFSHCQEKEMMKKVKDEIASCDILVALGDRAIGVGIEIGMAYAMNKEIVLEMSKQSATLKGVES